MLHLINKNLSIFSLNMTLVLMITACDKDESSTTDETEQTEVNSAGTEETNAGSDETSMETMNAQQTAGEMTMDDETIQSNPCSTIIDQCDGSFDPPPPLNEHSGTYVEEERLVVIFGGNTSVPENCGYPAYTGESTTWLYYDGPLAQDCGPWVKLEGGPPGRARHSAAYGEGKVWIFGGRVREGSSGPYDIFNDLWHFDIETRTWTNIEPSNAPPPARYNTSLTYDPTSKSLWVFGGNISGSSLTPDAAKDLWKFDIETSTWQQISTPNYLRDRMWHNAIYDTSRERLVIFGGADESAYFDDAVYFNDLIWYTESTDSWGRAEGGTAPDGRFWSQMVYRSLGDEYIIFGGHDDQLLGNRNDIWSFKPNEGIWTNLAGEDTYNRPANGFCDFPPDFTNVQRDLPERRNAHSFAWSQTCDHGIIFGGKTDCGAINDVWSFEVDVGWTNQELATAGESCRRWRSNPDNCSNMCF